MFIKPPVFVTGWPCLVCGDWHLGTFDDYMAKVCIVKGVKLSMKVAVAKKAAKRPVGRPKKAVVSKKK